MDLKIAASLYVLGQLDMKTVKEAVATALEQGMESPALRAIATGAKGSNNEPLADTFKRALDETGIVMPSQDMAKSLATRYYAEQLSRTDSDPLHQRDLGDMANFIVDCLPDQRPDSPLQHFVELWEDSIVLDAEDPDYTSNKADQLRDSIRKAALNYLATHE